MASCRGYTLLELMIAMVVGLVLISGIASAYAAIKATVLSSQQLADAQEVIRYSNRVLARSIKQSQSLPVVTATSVSIAQQAGVPACDGSVPAVPYSERFFVTDGYLTCQLDGTDIKLLKGVAAIRFSSTGSGRVITVGLQGEQFPEQYQQGVRMDIAATQLFPGL